MHGDTPGSLTERNDQRREDALVSSAMKRMFPILFAMMFMSYLDRGNLSVLGDPINASLGMSATAFGFAVGLFFWGYVIFEVPSNLALLRFGGRTWLARIAISWGAVTALMFFVQNEWQFGVLRFLLGATEAGLYPGILLFLTMWVPRSRQTRFFGVFQTSIPLAFIFSALLTSGLLALFVRLVGPSSGWRWVLLVEGGITIVVGVIALLVLANRPTQSSWLTDADARFLEARIAEEQTATHDPFVSLSKGARILRTLRSGRAWYLSALALLMLTGTWAVTYWLPQIIADDFGTSTVESGFLSAIPWVVAFIAILIVSRTSARWNDRRWHMAISLVLGAAGLAASTLGNAYLALGGLAVALASVQVSIPLLNRVQSNAFTGVMVAVVFAMVNSVGSFGGTIGPLIFGISSDHLGGLAPALWVMSAIFVVAALLALFAERAVGVSAAAERNSKSAQ